ncbi:Arginase/deacetylase [Piedraia hortae CBS 480.64]|uniref:histone deacetylase n=1 Tax=Piedraia hortae CBS 480.64 TaxID=1314780 RepID=A0A6A7C5D9_9PEZI|nr:Arginase/deacetylase [Piedraia hortae CBS 480.64]
MNDSSPYTQSLTRSQHGLGKTGLVYDVRMRFHVEPLPNEREVHPEDPRRIWAIFKGLVDAGLALEEGSALNSDHFMIRVPVRAAKMDEVCLVHTKRHWDWVQSLSSKTPEELAYIEQHEGYRPESVYVCPNTPVCASLSAGGAIEACRAVMSGDLRNAMAVIRPPGHHAEEEEVKGFCIYDNVSIATKVCQKEFGPSCKKVLILDWDVHHGNGIQLHNYEDPNVLYISIHVHENGRFYPEESYRDGRKNFGDHLHCGSGLGKGKNVNIPWRKAGMGDADYFYAFQRAVMPIATEFNPDLVIIAAGFDAADGDALGRCHVTPAGYAQMTYLLMSLAEGRVVACLEGGYNLDSISRSACAVARTLMGDPPPRMGQMNYSWSAVEDVRLVVEEQSKYWSCFQSIPSSYPRTTNLQTIIRGWQAQTYKDKYNMSPVHLSGAPTDDNSVLATPDMQDSRPLLMILHEPPRLSYDPNPNTGRVEPQTTWLDDPMHAYITWAIMHNISVVDISSSRPTDSSAHNTTRTRADRAEEWLDRVWQDFVSYTAPSRVFMLGTNIAHPAMTSWIRRNPHLAMSEIGMVISIMDDLPITSCKSDTVHELTSWYFTHSLVYLLRSHLYWDEVGRKPRRKFGIVKQTYVDSAGEMLGVHFNEITKLIGEDLRGMEGEGE